MASPVSGSYTFDNAMQAARERLEASAAWLDPWSEAELAATGVGAGWRCLEVGAGGGSIARWLAQRVGLGGHVVATDLDTRFFQADAGANLEVREHDLTKDPLEPSRYDLVHARLVLGHLPSREEVLTNMVEAIRPGGWIVIEDFDHLTLTSMAVPKGVGEEDAAAYGQFVHAALTFLASRGLDRELGCRLYEMLRARGLTEVHAEGHLSIGCGGSPFMEFFRLSAAQAGAALVGRGVSPEQFTRVLELCSDPRFVAPSHTLVSVRGRRAA